MPLKPSIQKRWTHRLLFGVFCVLWLGPLNYIGLFKGNVPLTGQYLNNLYRVSCLFTHRTPSWSNYYVEFVTDDHKKWEGVRLDDFSEMKLFGHATRLQRVLIDSLRDPVGGSKIRRRLGLFIRRELEAQSPDRPPIKELRFIRVQYYVGEPGMASPEGHWRVPDYSETSVEARSIVSHLRFVESTR